MKKLMFFLGVVFFNMSLQAAATEPVDTGMSFADIKTACQDPAQFQNQIAPSNIQVSCKEIQTRWVADSDGAMAMQSSRQVTTSVISDKYTVSPSTQSVPMAEQAMACPRFKEINESLETVRAVTCEEMIAFQGSETDFCVATLDNLKASNPAAIVTADTGKVMDYCNPTAKAKHK